jgi:sRNA-binding carbon storage regulator CsrA
MLVLARKPGQSVILILPPLGDDLDRLAGTEIAVTMTETHRSYARFGIEAPQAVLIVREELLTEQKEAT